MRNGGFTAVILSAMLGAPLAPQASAQLDPSEEVFYHFMPIAWRDSDNDPQRFGDFAGMEASLDYLEGLGVTAVWMNPIFPSPAYHGYQHGRADQLDPRFGTEAQWISFVEAAHARGIKVFLDFVVYGISHDSPWFQSAYANPASPYDSWLAFTNGSNTNYLGAFYNTWNGDNVGFIHWDLRTPAAANLVTGWAQHWLDPNDDDDFSDGVDGYRLDHVWVQYGSGPDGWGYNLDDFWEPWKAALQTVNPDVFTFAEQADWGSLGAGLLTAFDASMTKPFEFAARDALANQDAGPLYQAMSLAVAAVPADRTFMGLIGDHDVDRLASVIGGGFPRAKAAAAILMAQPFTPMIYFGDEIGMLGVKGNFGSDANDIPMREPFKWNAVAGPPMSNYHVLNPGAYNNAYSQDNDGRSVEEQEGVSGSLLETYRSLIATRKASPALTRGTYLPIPAPNPGVWAFVRQHEDQDVLVVINLTDDEQNLFCNLSAFTPTGGSTQPVDLITGWRVRTITEANKDAWPLVMQPYGFAYFELALDTYVPPPSDVDGQDIPADFGPAALVATQDTPAESNNFAELNQMFVAFEGDTLRVGLTGNLPTDGSGLCLMFDALPGGQNQLWVWPYDRPPYGPDQLSNMVLDEGFEPETMIFINALSGNMYVDQFTLLTGGGVDKVYRGANVVNSGFGILTGGDNDEGLQVALDNTNTLGVTESSATDAPTATTGFEFIIPRSQIGLNELGVTEVRISAFITRDDGLVGNQFLPGVAGSEYFPDYIPNLVWAADGDQFAVVAVPPLGCPGDLDGDDDTDVFDFTIFTSNFGQSVPTGTGGDIDGSGVVDVLDFGPFASDFGCTP